jgi:hypothetical protein
MVITATRRKNPIGFICASPCPSAPQRRSQLVAVFFVGELLGPNWRCVVGYAVRDKGFSLASPIEPDLGGLFPTEVFDLSWGCFSRACAYQDQACDRH